MGTVTWQLMSSNSAHTLPEGFRVRETTRGCGKRVDREFPNKEGTIVLRSKPAVMEDMKVLKNGQCTIFRKKEKRRRKNYYWSSALYIFISVFWFTLIKKRNACINYHIFDYREQIYFGMKEKTCSRLYIYLSLMQCLFMNISRGVAWNSTTHVHIGKIRSILY